MTTEEAVKLYRDAMASFGYLEKKDYSVDELDAIADEMRRVVQAKTDMDAAKVIMWRGCWDRRHTATRRARRIREIYNGTYNP